MYFRTYKQRLKFFNKPKVFGVGAKKTGTTSLKEAMGNLGFAVGREKGAEMLINDWAKRDFSRIIDYCHKAEFFQDSPFCLPYTFIILDHHFENAKFILTVRDSPEVWYDSYLRYQIKRRGRNGNLPTVQDFKNDDYIYPGQRWDSHRLIFNMKEKNGDLFNKKKLIDFYQHHNNSILKYFEHRPDDLLVLNVSDDGAYAKLGAFLGCQVENENFPWRNKTITK